MKIVIEDKEIRISDGKHSVKITFVGDRIKDVFIDDMPFTSFP